MNNDNVEFLIGDIITYDDIEYYRIKQSIPFSDGRYGFDVTYVKCANRRRRNHNNFTPINGKVEYKTKIYSDNNNHYLKKVDLNYLQELYNTNKEVLGL